MNEQIKEKVLLIENMLLNSNDMELVDLIFYFIREQIKTD